MRNSLRNSGIDIIGDVPWGTHFCQFYQTREDLIEILVPYFKAGLENNELCVWITSKPLKVEEAKAAMKRAVPDLDVYLKNGQIEIIPYTYGYLKDGAFDPEWVVNSWVEKIEQALARGYDGLRDAGDNRWLEKEGWNGFIDYENKVNAIIDKYHVIALCPYYLDMCSTAEVIDVVSNHQFALIKKEGEWGRIEYSGRKMAEKAVFQAVKDWEQTFDAVSDLITIIDDKYRIIRANRAMKAKLGVTPEECEGLTCYRAIHGTDSPPSFCPHRQLLKDGTEHTAEVFEDHLGGYFSVSTSPLHGSEGKLAGSVCVAHDINERKQEEHRIRRYNRILEGINRIFSNVVQAKTEEEVGNACLSVALEVTGSEFGFINEMGTDGLLHDVAKSELAWERCFMYDKTGHRHPQSDFAVHGLYGSVINNEKGFFTNDPSSHPDSIGIPEGHPPLTSFLGVPLVQDGKMIGLIVVANREGGYSCEQQGDLEAIAPAVVQVLQRKKAEQERMKTEDALSRERSLLESVMQTTDVMLVLLDPQFNFVWVNPAYAETCHMKPEEMVGKNHFALYPDAENEAIFRTVRDTGKGVFYKDKPFVFPDQPERGVTYWDWSLAPVKNSSGDVEGLVFSLRETTKYKKVEEALRESEERLRLLGDNLPDSAVYQYVYEPDGGVRFLYISSGIERLNGVNVQDVLRDPNTLYRQVLPEYLERLFEAKARSARELSDIDMELPTQLPDGRVKWMRLHSRPRRLPDGRTIWDGVQIDITENKKVEEALRKSEEHYRMLFSNMTEGFVLTEIVYDKDGRPYDYRYLEANPACELTHGIKKEELLGKTLLEVFPNTTTTTIKKFGEVALSGQSTTFEVFSPVVNKYVDVYAFSPEKGKLATIVRDITARKEAEARLKETLDNLEKLIEERTMQLEKAYNSLKESEKGLAEAQRMAHIGNWDWNPVTGEGYWSDELYHIFGRSPQKSAPSYNELLNYIHPDDRDNVDINIRNGLKEEPKGGIDYRIILADGGEHTVHSQAEVIFDEQKNPVRVKGIVQDITERKRIEAELELVARLPQENPDPVMRLNQGRIINYANPSAQVLLTDWDSAIGNEAPGEITELSVSALGDGVRRKLECTYANRIYMIDISPFQGAGYVNLYAHDITESKKAKEALEKIDKIRIKEIHHRIKNNLQVISSLLDLQAERFRNKEVLEAFRESQSRITSMSLIHEELYKGGENDTLNFSIYLKKLAENLFQTYSFKSQNVCLCMDLEENTLFDMDIAVPLGIIVNELVSNSLKHAFAEEEGEIQIKLCREEKGNEMHKSLFSLTISDNGIGIPESLNLENIESLGLQLVNILVDQLSGIIELDRMHGTEFRITFNVAERS